MNGFLSIYLEEFIAERLKNNLDVITARETLGKAGIKKKRVNIIKQDTKQRIYVPADIASWLKKPGNIEKIRSLKAKKK